MVQVILCQNAAIEPYIDDIARLRIEIFREYPYLYEGDYPTEANYLRKFVDVRDTMAVLLEDDGAIAGALTGLPLRCEDPQTILAPWAGEDIERHYYFSDALLLPAYRGHGYSTLLIDAAYRALREMGRYDTITLASIERTGVEPPGGYRSVTELWQKLGFTATDKVCMIPWLDTGDDTASEKPLRFWMRGMAG